MKTDQINLTKYSVSWFPTLIESYHSLFSSAKPSLPILSSVLDMKIGQDLTQVQQRRQRFNHLTMKWIQDLPQSYLAVKI